MAEVGKKWALVGPGAIGLNYGALLARGGISLSVLARSDFDVLSTEGISLRVVEPQTGHLNSHDVIRPAVVANDPAKIGPVDCVIIAAKSTVNQTLPASLGALVEPGRTVLLTLQNGMGNAEFLADCFPENPVLAGLCFVCANRTSPGVVENYLPGRVEIGSLHDRWPDLAQSAVQCFSDAGIKTHFAATFDAALWRKLCWNVPFNGLSIAGGGITTDCILSDSKLYGQARRLMEEVRSAADRAGHEISDRFLEGQFEVTAKMGAYKPSSLIDFLDGRAVEVESIWGEPFRRGQVMGVAMPELERLYNAIREKVLVS